MLQLELQPETWSDWDLFVPGGDNWEKAELVRSQIAPLLHLDTIWLAVHGHALQLNLSSSVVMWMGMGWWWWSWGNKLKTLHRRASERDRHICIHNAWTHTHTNTGWDSLVSSCQRWGIGLKLIWGTHPERHNGNIQHCDICLESLGNYNLGADGSSAPS